MGAVIGFLIGRTIFVNPMARKGLLFVAVLFVGSFLYLHGLSALSKASHHAVTLVTGASAIAIVFALVARAKSRRSRGFGVLLLTAIIALLIAAAWTNTVHPAHATPRVSHARPGVTSLNRTLVVLMLTVSALADCGQHAQQGTTTTANAQTSCDPRFGGEWSGIDSVQQRETLSVNATACTAVYNGVSGYEVATNGDLIMVVRKTHGTTDSDEFRLVGGALSRYRPNMATLSPPYRITLSHQRT